MSSNIFYSKEREGGWFNEKIIIGMSLGSNTKDIRNKIKDLRVCIISVPDAIKGARVKHRLLMCRGLTALSMLFP